MEDLGIVAACYQYHPRELSSLMIRNMFMNNLVYYELVPFELSKEDKKEYLRLRKEYHNRLLNTINACEEVCDYAWEYFQKLKSEALLSNSRKHSNELRCKAIIYDTAVKESELIEEELDELIIKSRTTVSFIKSGI